MNNNKIIIRILNVKFVLNIMAFSILDCLFILILSMTKNYKNKTKLLIKVLEIFKKLHIFINKKPSKQTNSNEYIIFQQHKLVKIIKITCK